jgi:predicted MPP superfamily phosphohydrolase
LAGSEGTFNLPETGLKREDREEFAVERLDLEKLVKRCGEPYVSGRLRTQVELAASVLGPGLGSFHFENLEWALKVFGWGLKLLGLWNRGVSNLTQHRIVQNEVWTPRLPDCYDGLRILHLSDLHLDVSKGMGAHIGGLCAGLEYDLALITGDFRFQTHSDYRPALQEIEGLAACLRCELGCFGILGNHDFLEFVPILESWGIKMLLNEAVRIEKQGSGLWIVGLDDAHFYGAHDYARAFSQAPQNEAKILMIHSPETLEDARRRGADFVLCGHTHGGQVCFPGGFPLWMNANCPRSFCRGPWEYQGMPGYTSSGAGSSGLPVRLNCPPEIVIHTLRAGRAAPA